MASHPHHVDENLVKQLEEPQQQQQANVQVSESWTSNKKKSSYNYQKLAQLIGKQPGLAIFRRFATLNAKNLLYLQAELAELEDQLQLLEDADQRSGEASRRQFQWVARLMMNAPPGADKQWQKVLEIRQKLKVYNELLLQHDQLYKLAPPNHHDLVNLRGWLEREEYGAFFLERPEDAWDTRYEDLVALSTRTKEGDRFTRWFTDRVVPFFHRHLFQRPREEDDGLSTTYEYSDKRLNRATEVVSIVVSSLLPTLSIFALHYIDDSTYRLAFILCFSAVFASCLAIFTAAKRIEIFTATVGLASVQVVFIGTAPGNGSGPGHSPGFVN